MEREELSAWLRLKLTPGVGDSSARKLLAEFGLPAAIFSQSEQSLSRVVSPAQAQALMRVPEELAALEQKTWDWLAAEPATRRVLPLGDPAYPQALLQMEDPPLMLHAVGIEQAWGPLGLNAPQRVCLAVVGSRNPTPQGLVNAHNFSSSMAQSGLTVVSGLALGIDGAAHEGALDGAALDHIATIAVVGTGLDRVYPKQHRVLAHRIAQRGVILSEYPLGTPPLAAHFPMRNRIISGLSRGTLVVEAAMQSGSLITARIAAEQGREVFAIPGSIHATQARGCHALIKQGAKLVESAQDILEELQLESSNLAVAPSAGDTSEVAEDDTGLLAAMGFEPCSLDALQARTGIDTAGLQAQLMALELDGQVTRLAGGLFQRLVRA